MEFLQCTHCASAAGRVEAFLEVGSCGEETITNVDGKLACRQAATHWDVLPSGDFVASCDGCSRAGDTLSCESCSDGQGGKKSASIALVGCTAVANDFGVLTCTAQAADESQSKDRHDEL